VSYKLEILKREITKLSHSDDWKAVTQEWYFSYSWHEYEGKCLCTHTPIYEHCLIKNKVTNNEAVVGNYCVENFMEMDIVPIVFGMDKIIDDPTKGISSKALIGWLSDQGWLTPSEVAFCNETGRKRNNLTSTQWRKRLEINERITSAYNSRIPPGRVSPNKVDQGRLALAAQRIEILESIERRAALAAAADEQAHLRYEASMKKWREHQEATRAAAEAKEEAKAATAAAELALAQSSPEAWAAYQLKLAIVKWVADMQLPASLTKDDPLCLGVRAPKATRC
jgi:hypothetical protein